MLGILCHDVLSTFAISTTTIYHNANFSIFTNFITISIISSADANLEAQIFHQTDSKNRTYFLRYTYQNHHLIWMYMYMIGPSISHDLIFHPEIAKKY